MSPSRMADRIGVMADGMLIAEGTLDELRRREGSGHGHPRGHLSRSSRKARSNDPARHESAGSRCMRRG